MSYNSRDLRAIFLALLCRAKFGSPRDSYTDRRRWEPPFQGPGSIDIHGAGVASTLTWTWVEAFTEALLDDWWMWSLGNWDSPSPYWKYALQNCEAWRHCSVKEFEMLTDVGLGLMSFWQLPLNDTISSIGKCALLFRVYVAAFSWFCLWVADA